MNTEIEEIGGIEVEIIRKSIKNLHIGCYPPDGRVRVAAPETLSDDAIRVAILTKITWIRRKQAQFLRQERQTPRQYVSGETHFLFGLGLRLEVREWDKRIHRISRLGSDRLLLEAPHGMGTEQKSRWMGAWRKAQLRRVAAPRLAYRAARMNVQPARWGLRPMRTKWGSCNPDKGILWLNTELAKKPAATIDYVIVHELAHLVSPRHDTLFTETMERELPGWRQLRKELNALPLSDYFE